MQDVRELTNGVGRLESHPQKWQEWASWDLGAGSEGPKALSTHCASPPRLNMVAGVRPEAHLPEEHRMMLFPEEDMLGVQTQTVHYPIFQVQELRLRGVKTICPRLQS